VPDAAFLERLERLPAWPPPAPVPDPVADRLENGRLGQYEIVGKIGRGGMGAVYKARHVELNKFVAIKVLPTGQMHEVGVARFKREVRAAGQLEHPNIVAALDAGQYRGVHYLVMALVDGVDLARLVDGHGSLGVADACEVARQAADGLQHAAECGLVHRDVKPSNLMLARDGLVKLLDLGLVRSCADGPAEPLTAAGTMLGTADYQAPEQWDRPQLADARADIYGLGCTLYHLLTGDPPFVGEPYESVFSKMRAHLEMPPPPVDAHRPDVPRGLAAVLAKMLAKDPADRFASPAEVAEALRPFAAGADLTRLLGTRAAAPGPVPPAATPRPGAPQCETSADGRRVAARAAAPARRRRRAAAVALAAVALPLVGACLGWWYDRRGPAGAVTPPVKITGMQVAHYKGRGKERVRDLQTMPGPVPLDDDVRVSARLCKPAYCYLIAFNPDGAVQLCHPAGADGDGAPGVRPEARDAVDYPAPSQVFVLDSAGLQAFVLAASAKPLPPFADWKAGAGAIPWKAPAAAESSYWVFDGRDFAAHRPQARGQLRPREDVPQSLRDLCEYFKGRAEFDAVRAVAFTVAKAPK
jgi:hypothetical protein